MDSNLQSFFMAIVCSLGFANCFDELLRRKLPCGLKFKFQTNTTLDALEFWSCQSSVFFQKPLNTFIWIQETISQLLQ